MNIKQFRKVHEARPFQGFDIHLTDGRAIPVSHPELLACDLEDETFTVEMPGGEVETIKATMIAAVKPRPPASARHGRQRGQSPEA
jgi:hypothetical protein